MRTLREGLRESSPGVLAYSNSAAFSRKASIRGPFVVHLKVLGGYVLLALALTYPLVVNLGSAVPAAAQGPGWRPGDGDPWQSLWGIWLLKHSLAATGRIPFATDLLFYPLGADLGLVSLVLLPGLAALPLVATVGAVIAYNVMVIAALVLAGYATFLLVRTLTADAGAAFVAGLVFAFSPYHMAHALEHLFLLVSALWIPLYALFLLRTIDDGGTGNTLLAALSMTCAMASNPYYAIFLALFTVLLIGARVLEAPESTARRTIVLRAAMLAVVGAVLAGPYAIFAARRLGGDAVITPSLGEVNHWSADILAFFVPSPQHPLWGALIAPFYREFTGNLFEQTVYLGYAALTLAVVAVGLFQRGARFWVWSGLVFGVLSLGPLLHLGGRSSFEIDGMPITIPLPGMLLYLLPVVGSIRVYSRFDVMVTLSLAVLVGFGIAALNERFLGGRRAFPRSMLVVVAGSAILFEIVAVPLPVLSTKIPPAFIAMGAEEGQRGSLLDIPLDWRVAKYQYYQTAHQRPLVSGFLPRPSPALIRQAHGVPFLDYFQDPDDGRRGDDWGRGAALRVIDLLDLDTIVIHGEYLSPAAAEQVRAVVTEYFPVARVIEDGALTIIRLRRDHSPRAVWTPDAYDFDFAPAAPRFFLAKGWWSSEAAGAIGMAWSMGRESTLGFFLPQPGPLTMELRLAPFVFPSAPRQAIAVEVNGRDLGEIALTREPGWRTYSLDVPTMALRMGFNVVRFTYRYAKAPRDVAVELADPRELAVAFSRVVLRWER